MPATQIPAKRTTRKAKAPASSPAVAATVAPVAAPLAAALTLTLPTLNPGERYCGIALDDQGTPTHHLVLMAQRPTENLDWHAAMDWAASVGGTLPTRQEQSLLFANCKTYLQRTWHWSCEEYEGNASFAWLCSFSYGYQYFNRKSDDGSAVAVRRLPINPSIL